jgi:hypothetical protein
VSVSVSRVVGFELMSIVNSTYNVRLSISESVETERAKK